MQSAPFLLIVGLLVFLLSQPAIVYGQNVSDPAAPAVDSGLIMTGPTAKPPTVRIPPERFRKWLDTYHPHFAKTTLALEPNRIVCINGLWDEGSRTLAALHIPFVRLRAGKLLAFPLANTKVLILCCGAELSTKALDKVREWVASGGALVSTDSVLPDNLQQAFPGFLSESVRTSAKDVVPVSVVSTESSLCTGLVSRAYWKIGQGSPLIGSISQSCKVLVRSGFSPDEDTPGTKALAVMFPYGQGSVLHIVGHYANDFNDLWPHALDDPATIIGVSLRQAITTNFIIARLQRQEEQQR